MFFIFAGIIEWILGIFLNSYTSQLNYDIIMFVYEWLIILTVVATVITWKKVGGNYLSPFTILYGFLVAFNAGQFIMWGFGIHYVTEFSSELGVSTHIRYMDTQTLMKILFVTLPSLSFFFSGVLLSSSSCEKKRNSYDSMTNLLWRDLLKKSGIPLLVLSYVITMYDTIRNISIASMYGYTSLYYGDMESTNNIVKYVSYMFLPSIFATYIGYGCSKKAFKLLSFVMVPYIVLNLLMGDRGSWIYFICLWTWCYLKFYENDNDKNADINIKQERGSLIKVVILTVVVLLFTTVFYKYREIGFQNVSMDNFMEVISNLSYVFIKPIFEMGQSARCLGILIQDDLSSTWDGGNTYLAGISAMVLPRIKLFFGFYDGYIENWFSQIYMGINNYGLGFTAIAEAYLNGGPFFYPVYMMLFGLFVGNITKYKNKVNGIDYKSLYFVLSSTVLIITACRGSIELSLRKWFYGCLLLYFLINIIVNEYRKRV